MPNLPMPEGLGTPDLECVMLNLAHIMIFGPQGVMPDKYKDDLFFGTTPELKYAQGAVSEEKAHATLMFGIHPSPSYRKNVDSVLKTWDMPETLFISQVSTFPIRDEDQEYYVIKGDVQVTPELLEGRARMEVLDHTDRFSAYHPHVTLAYVKRTADIDTWVTYLDDQVGGHRFEITGLDYGDDHE